MRRKFVRILVIFMILSVMTSVVVAGLASAPERRKGQLQVAAERPQLLSTIETPKGEMVSLIVDLSVESLASYQGGVNGLASTSVVATGANYLDVTTNASKAYLNYVHRQLDAFEANLLAAIPEAQVLHRYDVVMGGVSIVVPSSKAHQIAGLPGVKAVYQDQLKQPLTDASPSFTGATDLWADLGGQASAGEGIIVGVVDTGIWPEHPSFSDPDPAGNAYSAPPAKWTGSACDFGNTAWNANDTPFTCTNKLVGAGAFIDTYKFFTGLLPDEFDSARDDNGHGTHTSSTAAGNGGVAASILGSDLGLVSGIAPRAHVAMYRACADAGCYTSDLTAAINQAVADGVDVINYSIGGGASDPYSDVDALAFLDAYAAGVFVATSAGNSGPDPDTVGSPADAPWVMGVGASSHDRTFENSLTVVGTLSGTITVTEQLTLTGVSITGGHAGPVVLASDFGDGLCLSPFITDTWTNGEIVICERGVIARVAKSFNVAAGGAGGLVLYNPVLQSLVADNHYIPSIHIQNDAGTQLLDFMANHTNVTGTITAGAAASGQGDVMASFSSRGGPGQSLGVSKPDITAPGVQILAGHTPLPVGVAGGAPGELFQAIAGTSMSSPHIAGSAALLKALHPDWTPGQIKSALMTTAWTTGVTKEDGVTAADPFDYGSGRVNLSVAGDPGLTFNVPVLDFFSHKDDLWSVNYPSVYLPAMPGSISVQRTAHSELSVDSTWAITVSAPPDVDITVPASLSLPAGGDASFDIVIDARNVPLGEVRHATIYLTSNQGHQAHLPVTLVRGQAGVSLEKSCAPSIIGMGDLTTCTITATNTTPKNAVIALTDSLPDQLAITGTITGAVQAGNGVFANTPLAAGSLGATVDPLASPFGYVSLAPFSPFTVTVGDDAVETWSVPGFEFAGQTYSTISIGSNGNIQVGGGTSTTPVPSNFPDPALPNNVLAPYWTDLDPSAGGQVMLQVLSNGVDSWIVVEWEAVPHWGETITNTFQVWIGYTQPDDISFTYGPSIGLGGWSGLTVGAENETGTLGGTAYYDDGTNPPTGTPPAPSYPSGSYEVDVFRAPGGSLVVTYSAEGATPGRWQNCAEMSGTTFAGNSIACVNGRYGFETYFPFFPNGN